MKNPIHMLPLFTAVTFASLAIAVHGQSVVFSDNYEGYAAGTSELAGWAATSTLANYSVTVAAGTGVGGSQGLTWQSDFNSQWSGTLPINMGYSGGNPSGNTDADLNNYVLSFDLAVNSGIAVNQLQLSMNGWLGQWFSGASSSTGTGTIDTSAATVGSGFHHFTVNLGTFTTANSGNFNPLDQTLQFQFQLNGWQLAGGGPVTGESLTLDNLQIQTVPEPSTLALAGLGIGSLLAIRRKV